MKIKKILEKESLFNEVIYVSVDDAVFSGILRANSTAAFIIGELEEDCTEASLIQSIMKKYAIDEETASKACEYILTQLRALNLLE